MARKSNLPPGPGPGRPKGTPNKATANMRQALVALLDDNAPNLAVWLADIAKKQGSQAALRCLTDLMEYHVPKLARTELTGKDGKDLLPKVLTYTVVPTPKP